MIPAGVEIFVGTTPIDMRWGFERLSGIVETELGRRARSGALFVFFGRRAHTVKMLFFDGTGLWLLYKRLDSGVFRVGGKPVSEHALGKWYDHFADDSKCLPEGPTRAPNSHSRARHDAREAPKTAENTIRSTKTAQQAQDSRRAPRPQAHAIQNSR